MRYTYYNLCEDVAEFNGHLESDNIPKRFECGRRNGYTALDLYSVNADGVRENSGVDCNIQCGSPRECSAALSDYYSGLWKQWVEMPKLDFADYVIETLRNGQLDCSTCNDLYFDAKKRGLINE